MNALDKIKLAVTGVLILFLGSAVAQDDRDDATDVWIAVEAQWEAQEKGDKKWIDRMLADGFYGWSKQSPAPRSRSSTRMWERFSEEMGSIVAHELYPLEIVVQADTAIVHYLYSSAYKSKDGEIEMNNGRFTDVLIRTEDGWAFLGWHGGDD
ncbi:MAG: DUF4440 domain-containing protein [Woeseiaceae bacterium]